MHIAPSGTRWKNTGGGRQSEGPLFSVFPAKPSISRIRRQYRAGSWLCRWTISLIWTTGIYALHEELTRLSAAAVRVLVLGAPMAHRGLLEFGTTNACMLNHIVVFPGPN